MNLHECEFMLISRREKCRVGRRFVTRGSDKAIPFLYLLINILGR
jgi:hypothetical protein